MDTEGVCGTGRENSRRTQQELRIQGPNTSCTQPAHENEKLSAEINTLPEIFVGQGTEFFRIVNEFSTRWLGVACACPVCAQTPPCTCGTDVTLQESFPRSGPPGCEAHTPARSSAPPARHSPPCEPCHRTRTSVRTAPSQPREQTLRKPGPISAIRASDVTV